MSYIFGNRDLVSTALIFKKYTVTHYYKLLSTRGKPRGTLKCGNSNMP